MRNFQFLFLPKRLAIAAMLPLFLLSHGAAAAEATPRYIQGNYATPQSSETAVAIPYKATQGAGDLNVVIVGWNDSTARVSSVRDSKGNVYQLATGPFVTGALTQSIYYAKKIPAAAAATNTVTVSFSSAARYPDIRILEYSGIDQVIPVDTFISASGTSASCGSGTLRTTNSTDLLLAANMVTSVTSGAGSGFAQRLLTSPDADIAEDRVVTAVGSYSATAPLAYSGGWLMQLVAFRAASTTPTPTPSPTPTPKPTPTPTPTPKPSPTPTPSGSSSVTLSWNADAATGSAATNPVGYRLHLGTASGSYTQTTTLGKVTTIKVSSLTSGKTYYCVVTAYNSAGLDGSPSNQISFKAP
jgi:hypothetical protein